MNYNQLLLDKNNFTAAAGLTDCVDFNVLDMPGHKFFKIFFHFDNGDSNNGICNGGLLSLPHSSSEIPLIFGQGYSPTSYDSLETLKKLIGQSSAWTYLIENGEDRRAFILQKFISLLLEISISTPWYFLKISGILEAMERKLAMERDFKFEEQRSKISITCLPDAYDERMGTLLDMYRSIVFSWANKREVVPSNLRKFDMSIYIFLTPSQNVVKAFGDKSFENPDKPTISYKYFELHNCEIDYTSSKSGYGELNNAEGFNSEYTIDILFDDIYESRYNNWAGISMGDFIKNDTIKSLEILTDEEKKKYEEQMKLNNFILHNWPWEPADKDSSDLNVRLSGNQDEDHKQKNESNAQPKSGIPDSFFYNKKVYRNKGGYLHDALLNTADSLVTTGVNKIKGLLAHLWMGNLFKPSLSSAWSRGKYAFDSIAEGNLLTGIGLMKHVKRSGDSNSRTGEGSNLFGLPDRALRLEKENIPSEEEIKNLSNIFKNKSILNNI